MKPTIQNVKDLLAAGIDPKTGLPIKLIGMDGYRLKEGMKKVIRIIDHQDAVNRYIWYNLPSGMTSQLIENMLYHKSDLAFFYLDKLDSFFLLPYALEGTIDPYGRYNAIHPVAFGEGITKNEKNQRKLLNDYLSKEVYIPQYEVVLPEELDKNKLTKSCVILHDYSIGLTQTNIPRQILDEPIIELMSDMLPFMRTSLLSNTGVQGIRVNGPEGNENVVAANSSLDNAALTGHKYVPITDNIEFQELTGTNAADCEQFLEALQGLDNYRLGMLGLENGGLFQKKEHVLQSENDMNGGNVGLVLQDGLTIRQEFCNIVNSIWGLGIWCDVSEASSGDANLDGFIGDEGDPEGGMTDGSDE